MGKNKIIFNFDNFLFASNTLQLQLQLLLLNFTSTKIVLRDFDVRNKYNTLT